MKISELARTAGLPVATVKYYLRDGLLPPGRSTSATQADYDETHVRRLRLVRALAEIGGLTLADVREVLATLDAPGFGAIARAHSSLPPVAPEGTGTARAKERAATSIAQFWIKRWRFSPRKSCSMPGNVRAVPAGFSTAPHIARPLTRQVDRNRVLPSSYGNCGTWLATRAKPFD